MRNIHMNEICVQVVGKNCLLIETEEEEEETKLIQKLKIFISWFHTYQSKRLHTTNQYFIGVERQCQSIFPIKLKLLYLLI